jgi:hypothetical protein
MAKNTAAIPAKTTGSTYAAAEFEVLRDFVDSPLQSLGAISTPITIDGTGSYNVDTLAANRAITFAADANHVDGNTKVYNAIGNGTYTFTISANDTPLAYDGFTNGGALAASLLHRFAFTYLDGYIHVDYSAKTLIPADVTAPTFSNVSVDNLAATTADFNAEIDEAGTIYWAAHPTATSQRTKAQIAAGTGSIDFGTIVTAGSTIETANMTGFTASTAYKVHYYGSDGTNESVATLTSEFSTTIILFEYDFAGVTPDPLKITITDPADAVTVSQNNQLIFSNTGAATVSWALNYGRPLYTMGTDFVIAIDIGAATAWVGRNYGIGVVSTAGNTLIYIRAKNNSGEDSDVFFTDSDGTNILPPNTWTGVALQSKTWRIRHTSNVLYWEYWGGASWTVAYSQATAGKIDSDLVIDIRSGDDGLDSAGTVSYDNLYICSASYLTQYPV